MPSRRFFLSTLPLLAPSLTLPSRLLAANAPAADPSKVALVIGNNAYSQAPLLNPVNDAKAMANLFGDAGFTVHAKLNAKRKDMVDAIESFGSAIGKPEIKLVVFYYAGHGAQLNWNNYLVPVDAEVESTDQVRSRCVDLNVLMTQFGKVKDKTFIIILDACRNNPFGSSYRLDQKGLSQFDAPAGSLLAYATAPGSVASDGKGDNGLYTENLMNELAVPGTRIEDALKRVRLKVRLASRGAQIPWETTSLERDVYLYQEPKKASAADIEKQLETEIVAWNRVKNSKEAQDWIVYLRDFPNGHFSEVAQVRLTALLAEREARQTSQPAKPTATTSVQVGAGASGSAPQLITPSANPHSAGIYPLQRIYTVGDVAVYADLEYFSRVKQGEMSFLVTAVDKEKGRIEINDGENIYDLMGNWLKVGAAEFNTPVQNTPAEFYVGKKWRAAHIKTVGNTMYPIYNELQIVAREKIVVPAGEFDTFKIQSRGVEQRTGMALQGDFWLVPNLNFEVKREWLFSRAGVTMNTGRRELISLRQQSVGLL